MNKKIPGFLAFAPFVLYLIGMFIAVGATLGDSSVGVLIGGGMIRVAVILSYVVMIVFIIQACKNPRFTDSKKLFWGVMFFLFGMFSYPIFWFKYIRKYNESDDDYSPIENERKNCFYSRNGESSYETSSYPENWEKRYEIPSYEQNTGIHYEVQDNTAFYSRPTESMQRGSRKTEEQKKKERKVLLIFALLPTVILLIAIIALIFGTMTMNVSYTVSDICAYVCGFAIVFYCVSFCIYSYQVCVNSKLNLGTKILWVIFFLTFSFGACPIYWGTHIQSKKEGIK